MNVLNNARWRGVIAGGIGGFVGWIPVELLVAPRLEQIRSVSSELYTIDALFGALSGLAIGLALGAAGGLISYGFTRRAWITAGISAAAGLIGGALGLMIGETVYQPLRFLCFVGRSLGWAAFGAVLGSAEGITRKSWVGLRNAALGGLIGGALGGFAFDLVAVIIGLATGSGGSSRMVALTILGACIGLWIVVMERALADGVLKVVSGRQEGREFYLDKPLLTVGRDEHCDVALFGDLSILPRHATIRQESGVYVLQAEPGAPVQVNRQPVSRQGLAHENEVMVGNTRLIYRSRKAMQQDTGRMAQSVVPPPTPVLPPVQPPPPQQARPDVGRMMMGVRNVPRTVQPPPPVPQPQVRYCGACGTPNRVGARFCTKCGKQLLQIHA
jgi:pSer/pThr/pTyr-binding forkhead associated (FHA) protein